MQQMICTIKPAESHVLIDKKAFKFLSISSRSKHKVIWFFD